MKTTRKLFGIILALMGGLATPLDAQNLFVAVYNGTIGEYTMSGAPVNFLLISGLSFPDGMAISGNDLFVANYYNNTIGEYTTSGQTVNVSLISGLDGPVNIAISGTNLFVENSGDTIGEYTTSGATVNASLISASLGQDYEAGMAISGNDLFVVNWYNGSVGEYTTSGATNNASLITGLDHPEGIAISGNGHLFVASGNTIGEYTTSGVTINASLISGLGSPTGIAISGTNLFVMSDNTIGEYTTSGATVNASMITVANPTAIATPVLVPPLSITTAGSQNVLYYPYSTLGTNYVLQCVTNLASTNWLTVSNGTPVIGVTVPNNLPASFFRLVPAQ